MTTKASFSHSSLLQLSQFMQKSALKVRFRPLGKTWLKTCFPVQ